MLGEKQVHAMQGQYSRSSKANHLVFILHFAQHDDDKYFYRVPVEGVSIYCQGRGKSRLSTLTSEEEAAQKDGAHNRPCTIELGDLMSRSPQ